VIPLPEATYSPAAARIQVGLYDLLDGVRALLADGDTALVLAPLAIRARTLQTRAGEVPNAVQTNFANQIELVGYEMDRRALRPGETLRLTLYWRALAPLRVNYSAFAHVRGEGETQWAGADAWPRQGAAPTSAWRVGELLRDPYDLTLRPDTPPGTYHVEVGLYDASIPALPRLHVVAPDGRPTDADFVLLSKIRVVVP
jgi:hypothetical protein